MERERGWGREQQKGATAGPDNFSRVSPLVNLPCKMTMLLIFVLLWDWPQSDGWCDRDLRALLDLQSCGCTRTEAETFLLRCQRHFGQARIAYLDEMMVVCPHNCDSKYCRQKSCTRKRAQYGQESGAGGAGDVNGMYPGESIETFFSELDGTATWWSGKILRKHKTRDDLWLVRYVNGDKNWVKRPDPFGCVRSEPQGEWDSDYELGDRIMEVYGGCSARLQAIHVGILDSKCQEARWWRVVFADEEMEKIELNDKTRSALTVDAVSDAVKLTAAAINTQIAALFSASHGAEVVKEMQQAVSNESVLLGHRVTSQSIGKLWDMRAYYEQHEECGLQSSHHMMRRAEQVLQTLHPRGARRVYLKRDQWLKLEQSTIIQLPQARGQLASPTKKRKHPESAEDGGAVDESRAYDLFGREEQWVENSLKEALARTKAAGSADAP